ISFDGILRCWYPGEEPDGAGHVSSAVALEEERGELRHPYRRSAVPQEGDRAAMHLGKVPPVAPGISRDAAYEPPARQDSVSQQRRQPGLALGEVETVAGGEGIRREGTVRRRVAACDLRARASAAGPDVVEVPPQLDVLVENPAGRA